MKRFYKKKPVVVEAIQLTKDSFYEVCEFLGIPKIAGVEPVKSEGQVIHPGVVYIDIDTLEGAMRASEGDWIIKGIKGEFYPCKPDIFEATYDLAYIDTEGEDIGGGSTTYMGSRDF